MVEQKHNMEPKTQEEVNVSETHKKPKHDSLLVSRRRFLKGAAGLGATVMFGGLLGGCGDEQQASTTEKSNSTSITQTTISENPTTTNAPYASTTLPENTTSITKESTTTTELQKPDRLVSYKILDYQFAPKEIRDAIEAKNNSKIEKITFIDAYDPIDYQRNIHLALFGIKESNGVAFTNQDGQVNLDYFSVSPVIDRNQFRFSFGARIGSDFILEFVLNYKKEGSEDGETFAKRTYDLFSSKTRFPGELQQELLSNTKEIILTDPFNNNQKVVFTRDNQDALDAIIKSSKLGDIFYNTVSTENTDKKITKEDVLKFTEGLIGNKTVEDLKEYINLPEFKQIRKGQFVIQENIQDTYKEHMPNDSIIYVGDPNDMTGRTWLPSRPFINTDGYELPVDGIGVLESNTRDMHIAMVAVFDEVVLLSFDNNNPNGEFLINWVDPVSGRSLPTRINFESENNTGLHWVYNLQKEEQTAVVGAKQKFVNQIKLGTNFKLSDVLIPGAPYLIMFNYNTGADGKDSNLVDENGFRKIRSITPFAADEKVEKEILDKF